MLRLILVVLAVFALALPSAAATKSLGQSEAWFYIARNQVIGPYAEREIVNLAEDGVIRSSTQVFDPARGWAFAKDMPVLQPYVGAAPSSARRPAPPAAPEPPAYVPPPQSYNPPQYAPVPPYVPPPAPVPPPQTYDVKPVEPSGSVSAELERAIGDYLAGTWSSRVTQEISGSAFDTAVEHTFRPGGSYEALVTVSAAYAPAMEPTREIVSGVWRVRPLSPDRFVLTIDGPDGVKIDEKTMRIDSNGAMSSVENGVTFNRVR